MDNHTNIYNLEKLKQEDCKTMYEDELSEKLTYVTNGTVERYPENISVPNNSKVLFEQIVRCIKEVAEKVLGTRKKEEQRNIYFVDEKLKENVRAPNTIEARYIKQPEYEFRKKERNEN